MSTLACRVTTLGRMWKIGRTFFLIRRMKMARATQYVKNICPVNIIAGHVMFWNLEESQDCVMRTDLLIKMERSMDRLLTVFYDTDLIARKYTEQWHIWKIQSTSNSWSIVIARRRLNKQICLPFQYDNLYSLWNIRRRHYRTMDRRIQLSELHVWKLGWLFSLKTCKFLQTVCVVTARNRMCWIPDVTCCSQ